MRKWLWLSCLLMGCSSVPISHSPISLPLPELSPASLAGELNLMQRLSFVFPQGQQQLEALLEVDANSLQLAGLYMGQRVLTIAWDGQYLSSDRYAGLPVQVNEEYILRDIQYVFWPIAVLRTRLPNEWLIVEQQYDRILYYKNQVVMKISYANERPMGKIVLDNYLEHYQLHIDSVPQTGDKM